MALSYELMSQFAKLVTKNNKTNSESTVYGTIVEDGDGNKYVKLDGTDQLTQLTDENRPTVDATTTNANAGDRVTVLIKDHTAVVTGNVTSPAATSGQVNTLNTKVEENLRATNAYLQKLEAEKINTAQLDAAKAEINDLIAQKANISDLEATDAVIKELDAKKLNADVADMTFATIDNLTATNANVTNLTTEYGEFKNATVKNLESANANIEKLQVDKLNANDADLKYATIENLDASDAKIDTLTVEYGKFEKATIDDLNAKDAEISSLKAGKLDANDADLKYATIENLEATDAKVETLTAEKANITDLDATNAAIKNLDTVYADIDFANVVFADIDVAKFRELFSEAGIIKYLQTSDGTFSGELVGVTIKGDLIEGNTIVADKLVVKGEDGIYYALNFEGGALTGDKVADSLYYRVEYNEETGEYVAYDTPTDTLTGTLVDGVLTTDGRDVYSTTNESGETIYYCVDSEWANENLHGSILVAKSVTANKIQVDDLVAFDATIGGFRINQHNIHSGVKESVDSPATGIYMDDDGQFSIGDDDEHIKYYRDIDGSFKLKMAAESLAAQLEEATMALRSTADNIEKHFSFTSDGLVISAGENQMSIRIDNDIVMFEKNGVLFGWWDGINFHTGNIQVEVDDRAQFGNFAFIPRSDGSLSFLKVDHNTGFYIRLAGGIMVIYGVYPTLEDTTLLITDIIADLDDVTLILGGE